MPEEPDEPLIPEDPEEPLEPEEPEVPELPSPPLAPSKFTVQLLYVPLPTTLVGEPNVNTPVPLMYDITSHSWKLDVLNTTIIDCAGEYANPVATVKVPLLLPKLNESVDVVLYKSPFNPDEPEFPLVPDDPVNPDVPEEPEEPFVPEIPEEPFVPDVPEEPEAPEEPFVPEVPEEPFVPDVPEKPLVPEAPEEPLVPEVPEEPFVPDVITVYPKLLLAILYVTTYGPDWVGRVGAIYEAVKA